MSTDAKRTELVDVLRKAGLSPYQADAYVTILEMGSGTATTIAEESGVPDSRIYDVLRDLEDEGYIETYQQDSLRARVSNKDRVLEELRSLASQFTDVAETIDQLWETPEMEETAVSIVSRFDTVLERGCEGIDDAELQVLVCLHPTLLEDVADHLEAALERGVKVKVVLATVEDDPDLPAEDRLETLCSEARVRPLASPFVTIVDRTETYFAPHGESIEDYSVLANDRTYTNVFYWYFLTVLWDLWNPVYERQSDGFPREYTDIRYCIFDIEPLLDAGTTIEVTVEGIDVESREECVIEGTVGEIVTSGVIEGFSGHNIAARYAGQAALVVETADGPVEVGGWSAALEDVACRRIVVESVR